MLSKKVVGYLPAAHPLRMNLQIRQYSQDCYSDVVALHIKAAKSIWPKYKRGPWDEDLEQIDSKYLNSGGEYLLGYINEELAVMGAYWKIDSSRVEMRRMRVDPDHHRRGLGQHILTELEKSVKAKGYSTIELHTTIDQVPAQKLYEKNGYALVRRSVDGPGSERLHYEKQL
jgi:ribosomal protein S18 acetylase RimI-like enzyme